METMKRQRLATDAKLNHWPPHLGVKTDTEKIEYLAAALEEVGDIEARVEGLQDDLETAREHNDRLIDEVNDLKEEIVGLKDEKAALELSLTAARERIQELEARP